MFLSFVGVAVGGAEGQYCAMSKVAAGAFRVFEACCMMCPWQASGFTSLYGMRNNAGSKYAETGAQERLSRDLPSAVCRCCPGQR